MVLLLRNSEMTFFDLSTDVEALGQSFKVNACNPCICEVPLPTEKNAYTMNVRWINSGYDAAGVALAKPSRYISSNSRLPLDGALMPSGPQTLLETLEGEPWSMGHQDIRLVSHGGKIHYLAGKAVKGCIQQVYGSYLLEGKSFLASERLLTPNFINPWGVGEKNWVFFPQDEQLTVIHSWHPLRICKIDGNALLEHQTIPTPRNFKNFRGSSSMFILKDQPAFLVHEVAKKRMGFMRRGKEILEYQHRIVLFNQDCNSLVAYSEPFKFGRCNIEFCTSAVNVGSDVVIAGSIMDRKCFLCRMNAENLRLSLRWAKV